MDPPAAVSISRDKSIGRLSGGRGVLTETTVVAPVVAPVPSLHLMN